jgi:hypothetical protein
MEKIIPVFLIFGLLTSCGGITNSSDDTNPEVDDSASGIALSLVGGALSGTSSSGTQTLTPFLASETCLKPTTAFGSPRCTTSGKTMWLQHLNCNFAGSSLTWSGTAYYQVSGAESTNSSCGTFPVAGNSGTMIRQYVSGLLGVVPSEMSRTNTSGQPTKVDDSSPNLGTFDVQHTVATLINGGYGVELRYNSSGARSTVKVLERQYLLGSYDYSLEGTLVISETTGASSRTLNGTVQVYDNLKKVIGTTLFSNVVHSNACCTPVSGTLTTSFAASTNPVSPTADGAEMVGKTETLTITGCGTGTLLKTDETTENVLFTQCF